MKLILFILLVGCVGPKSFKAGDKVKIKEGFFSKCTGVITGAKPDISEALYLVELTCGQAGKGLHGFHESELMNE